ncbi:trypsin-like peptidase domain-containing protein, partial [Lancefieldella parvula]|uniref:S1C family serine protease n=1 Tax=Lancefieldella parvula TaxID=1382 RepID=UPI0028D4AF27
MENQAHGLTTDSTVNKRFSSVKQAGFMSMFKSSSVKRTACAIAFAVACVPTIALGEGISKLPAVSGQATISQAAARPAAEPTDTKTAETVASKVLPSVVSVKATSDSSGSTGSGVVLNTNGDILTNYHVIEGMDTFSISVNDKEYECTVVGTDPTSDLAVLHADLKGDSLTPIEIGNSDNLAPGSWVMSVGSPFGLD